MITEGFFRDVFLSCVTEKQPVLVTDYCVFHESDLSAIRKCGKSVNTTNLADIMRRAEDRLVQFF